MVKVHSAEYHRFSSDSGGAADIDGDAIEKDEFLMPSWSALAPEQRLFIGWMLQGSNSATARLVISLGPA